MKVRNLLAIILSVVIIASSAVLAVVGIGENKTLSASDINLGLDLAGGVSITYQTATENPTEKEMTDTENKLRRRITDSGYTEFEVYREGGNRINVDIPSVSDPNKVLEELGKPGNLAFVTEDGNVVVSGADVKDANFGKNPDGLGYVVTLDLNSEGAKKFAEATEANVGKIIYIIYDNKVLMSPRVNEKISDGSAMISGMNTAEDANNLASYIRIGALPLELEELRSQVVGAKMGQDAIDTSVKAALIGIALVFVFMIAFYRLPGVIASVALTFYAALLIILLNVFGITLTLPGIMGMILSIGMAVDANVIIFSRIREELAQDKTVRSSVKAGFRKATTAIIDGNVTTLIAAAVLYIMGTGPIRGFAETLALGIILSMFTALVVTRVLLTALVELGSKNRALYGVTKNQKVFRIIEKTKITFAISAVVVIVGIIAMPVNSGARDNSLNYDIEFAGGTSTSVATRDKVYSSLEELQADIKEAVVEATGDQTPQMNIVDGANGQGQFIVKTTMLSAEQKTALANVFIEKYGITAEEITSETISPTISKEMSRDAIIAVIIAAICILLYITFRFRDYKFGIAAVAALVHDVLIVLAVYSIFFVPVNNSFIAAMLTIVGYSINDTIVLFDRVRENQKYMKRGDYHGVVNKSISQTVSRSINTSLTTFIMVCTLYVFGVESIREFAFPLMIGLLSGTYSSIFIASPLWYIFKRNEEKKILNAHQSN